MLSGCELGSFQFPVFLPHGTKGGSATKVEAQQEKVGEESGEYQSWCVQVQRSLISVCMLIGAPPGMF